METKKSMKVSKASIVFYVAAVIFLAIAAFEIYQTYQSIVSYKTQYSLQLMDVLNLYFTGCVPYFGFAFISYGIGEVLKKVGELHAALSLCIEDAIEDEAETESEEHIGDTACEQA